MTSQKLEAFQFSLGRDNFIWSFSYHPVEGLRYRPYSFELGPSTPLFFDTNLLAKEGISLLALTAQLPASYSQPSLGVYRNDGDPEAEGRVCLSFKYGNKAHFYMQESNLDGFPILQELLSIMVLIRGRVLAEIKSSQTPD